MSTDVVNSMSQRIYSDKAFEWRPKSLFIPVQQFTGLLNLTTMKGGSAGTAIGYTADAAGWKITKAAATDRASVNVTQTAAIGAAADPSTRTLIQLTGINIAGMVMTTAADEVQHFLRLPNDLDIQKPIGFYVWWTSEAAAVGARTITWRVRYTAITPNTTAAIASPATALDTTIGAQAPVGTSLAIQRTTDSLAGFIAPSTLTEPCLALQLRVDMSAFDASLSENKYLLGLEMSYSPRRLRGPDGMSRAAKMPTPVLGRTYQ